MKAVRFDEYGGLDVLYVADVPIPEPEQGEALVRVKAAAINPGEAGIREGRFHEMFPATFPSGEGSDLAGIVEKLGPGATGVKIGDEVIGWTDRRASHAEYVVVGAQHLAPKPAEVSWEAAGSLASCRVHSLRRGAGRLPAARRHGGRVRRGGGRRIDRRPVSQTGRRAGDRHRQQFQARLAGRARGEPRPLRRGPGRPAA